MTSELRDQLASTLGESFRVVRELSGGGMARVFVAHDHRLDRDIVVKALSAELTASLSLDRFRREIQIAAALRHPCIVPVLSAGQSLDLLYYTMPFIEGASLRTLLDTEGQLSCDAAVRFTVDVARALEYAHGQKVIHRDIKPDNILIDGEHALVTDFGIARAIESAIANDSPIKAVTSTGITLGTPTYMSPEQAAADRELDGRSDIYSLACVLHEMLSGDPPFTGNPRAVLARHIQERPPSLHIVRPDLPDHVVDATARALSKVPADRFATAAEFADALEGRAPARALRGRRARARMRTWYIVAAAGLIAMAGAAFAIRDRRPAHAVTTSSMIDPRTLAVLYLDAPASDTGLTALAHGITRDLIARLSAVPGLTLISESGIRRFERGAGANTISMALNAGTIVTGSVEPDGQLVRVDVQLIDPATLAQTGSVRVSMVRGRSLSLRDSVVSEVAAQLRRLLGDHVQLHEWKSATSPRAWELRQQAADILEPVGAASGTATVFERRVRARLADSLLTESARIDPRWLEPVLARGWLASHRALDASTAEEGDSSLRAGLAIAESALRQAPGDPHAYELRGFLRFQQWRMLAPRRDDPALADSAEADLLLATRNTPSAARAWSALSLLHQQRGDADGALAYARRALHADPYLREVASSTQRLIFAHLFAGRNDSARVLCVDATRRFPDDAALRQCELNVLGWTASSARDYARASALLRRAERESVYTLARGTWPPGRYYLAAIHARGGRQPEARAAIQAIRDSLRGLDPRLESPLTEAYVWTLLAEHDSALVALRRAATLRLVRPDAIDRYPWFAPLRADPAYRRLIASR